MWFQSDGCLANYARIFREVLDREYSARLAQFQASQFQKKWYIKKFLELRKI